MSDPFRRRLAAEWDLLQELAVLNPARLTGLRDGGAEFHLRLHGTPALSIPSRQQGRELSEHDLRFDFPVHFPAVPMELYLHTPVFHPNVHPETGFVCLWERHRVTHTVEHAMHKLVAMLAGCLQNAEPLHVMQPAALGGTPRTPMPLQGVRYEPVLQPAEVPAKGPRRGRLQ